MRTIGIPMAGGQNEFLGKLSVNAGGASVLASRAVGSLRLRWLAGTLAPPGRTNYFSHDFPLAAHSSAAVT